MEVHNDDNVLDIVLLSLSLLLSIINCFQCPDYSCIRSIITWNINRLCAPRYGRQRVATLDGEPNVLLGRVSV